MRLPIQTAFLTALCAASFLLVPARAADWSEGDLFPDLKGFALEGEVPDLERKVVLVDFWASWCPPCKASFPTLNELIGTYGEQGLVVLAVNVDTDLGAFEKFVQRTAPEFSVVRDGEQKLVAAAGVSTMPTSFLVDRNGVIRSVHSGYHGDKTREVYIEEIEALLGEAGGTGE